MLLLWQCKPIKIYGVRSLFFLITTLLVWGQPLAQWRWVSNYIPYPHIHYDLSLRWEDLRAIKRANFNAVGREFQPSLDPSIGEEGGLRKRNKKALQPLHLPDGEPLLCIYFFGHWWEPWKNDDSAIRRDLKNLKGLGFNTILVDHEFSQMLDGNWKWLDREHRLAKEAGFYIVPWLEAHCGWDITVGDRAKIAGQLYNIPPIPLSVDQDGKPTQPKVYSEEFKRYLISYVSAYINRYLKEGRILRVLWEGKERPVISLSCEMDFTAFDEETNRLFQEWLRKRYKNDIQSLNALWGTRYRDFAEIDPRNKEIFDYSRIDQPLQPIAVMEHARFRAELCDLAFEGIKRELLKRYPNLLFLAEVPYQFGSLHPHALSYQWGRACLPEIVRFADIVLIRGTQGRLTPREIEEIGKLKRRGQKVIFCYRVSLWIDKDFGEDIAKLCEGLGYYSWNEMVDCHIVENPPGVGREEFRIDEKTYKELLRRVREANEAYLNIAR